MDLNQIKILHNRLKMLFQKIFQVIRFSYLVLDLELVLILQKIKSISVNELDELRADERIRKYNE